MNIVTNFVTFFTILSLTFGGQGPVWGWREPTQTLACEPNAVLYICYVAKGTPAPSWGPRRRAVASNEH